MRRSVAAWQACITWCPHLQRAVSHGCRIMSWPGIPRAAACVSQLMPRTLIVSERQKERGRERAQLEKVGRTCLRSPKAQGESWARATPGWSAGLYTQSWNRPDHVRKAGALCDKLTPGNSNRQKEDMEKENMAGGECWRRRWEGRKGHQLYWPVSCPQNRWRPHLFFSEWPNQKMALPMEREGQRGGEGEETGSKCTPKQISKCRAQRAQRPQRGDHPHRVGGVLYHPHLILLSARLH